MKEFAHISDELFEKLGVDIKNNDYSKADICKIAAYIVNASFMCELSLKGIAEIKRITNNEEIKIKNTHRLNELFNRLNNNTKEIIINKMQNYCSNDKRAEFSKALDEISNNFPDWRYFYEKNQVTNLLFLRDLSKVLEEYVMENYGCIQM
ncbi:MAG: hypothetical protein ACI30B_00100 [Paludibacteraceae bacterium]